MIVAILVATASSYAASAPEARSWVEKMARAFEHGPYTVTYTGRMDLDQGVEMTMRGTIVNDGPNRQRNEMTMTMTGVPGSDGPVEATSLVVADGTTLWLEMNHPLAGGPSAMKVRLDELERLGERGIFGGDPTAMDPVSQIRAMADSVDLELVGVADGRVTLRGMPNAEAARKAGLDPAQAGGEITLVLDEKTGAPASIEMGDGAGGLSMSFEEFRYLKTTPELTYEPPEGVTVRDFAEMLESAPQGGPAYADPAPPPPGG